MTEAAQAIRGKTLLQAEVLDNALFIVFMDGTSLRLWDGGQSCCEARYMVCDDDLGYYIDTKLRDIEVRDGPAVDDDKTERDCWDDFGAHEQQFLVVKTDKGEFVVSNHNEHNGYYGGFDIEAELTAPEQCLRLV